MNFEPGWWWYYASKGWTELSSFFRSCCQHVFLLGADPLWKEFVSECSEDASLETLVLEPDLLLSDECGMFGVNSIQSGMQESGYDFALWRCLVGNKPSWCMHPISKELFFFLDSRMESLKVFSLYSSSTHQKSCTCAFAYVTMTSTTKYVLTRSILCDMHAMSHANQSLQILSLSQFESAFSFLMPAHQRSVQFNETGTTWSGERSQSKSLRIQSREF